MSLCYSFPAVNLLSSKLLLFANIWGLSSKNKAVCNDFTTYMSVLLRAANRRHCWLKRVNLNLDHHSVKLIRGLHRCHEPHSNSGNSNLNDCNLRITRDYKFYFDKNTPNSVVSGFPRQTHFENKISLAYFRKNVLISFSTVNHIQWGENKPACTCCGCQQQKLKLKLKFSSNCEV